MNRVRILLLALLLGTGLVAQAARSAPAEVSTDQSSGMSLERAIAMVQSKYGAKVMRANTVEEDGRVVHYIRLISADRSRVWTVRVDAATGREF